MESLFTARVATSCFRVRYLLFGLAPLSDPLSRRAWVESRRCTRTTKISPTSCIASMMPPIIHGNWTHIPLQQVKSSKIYHPNGNSPPSQNYTGFLALATIAITLVSVIVVTCCILCSCKGIFEDGMLYRSVQSKGWTWTGGEAPWKASKIFWGHNSNSYIFNEDLVTALKATQTRTGMVFLFK